MLRPQTGGEPEVEAAGATVGEVLRALTAEHPDTEAQLFAADGELNRYVNVYLNDEDVRVLDGLDTAVSDGDTVVILPAMAGGALAARSVFQHQPEEALGALLAAGCRAPARAALLDDHAVVHEDDPVADVAGEAHLVGDDDHRHPLRGQLAHHVEHLLDQLGVERAGHLVEEHHVRVHRQRAGDRDPLLLAAGEPFGVLVELVGEPDPLEQRGCLRP